MFLLSNSIRCYNHAIGRVIYDRGPAPIEFGGTAALMESLVTSLRLLACAGLRQREVSRTSWHEIQGNLLVLPESRDEEKARASLSDVEPRARHHRLGAEGRGVPRRLQLGQGAGEFLGVDQGSARRPDAAAQLERRGLGDPRSAQDRALSARLGTPIHITEKVLNHVGTSSAGWSASI